MKVKHFIFVLACILVLSGIKFLLDQNDHENKSDTLYSSQYTSTENTYYEYSDEEAGYKILYPADWSLEDHSFKDEMIRADLYWGDQAGIQIRLEDQQDLSDDIFVESYIKRYQEDMKLHWRGEIKIESVDKRNIGCCSGYEYKFIQSRENGSNWLLMNYLWFADNKVYIFQGGVSLKMRDELEFYLIRIAESFTITL